MANQKSTKEKQQYFIPFEVTEETIITEEYKNEPVQWLKIGNSWCKGILVPATKEVYLEYMRPIWREEKRQQRQAVNRKKREVATKNHMVDKTIKPWDTAVSFESLLESGYSFEGISGFEDELCLRELINKLQEVLLELEETNRIIMTLYFEGKSETEIGKVIGMSQKGVNKRKHKCVTFLRERLKDYI